ncbi:MAG TPA: helix-turn-helix domain-containing protein [Acidimicrobiales bacterium]|nr:helix-turn-helix domain-containing protein [Acidimicrobiales bacterium]
MEHVSSGVADIDDLLGDLIPGDNIVWVSDYQELLTRLENAFIEEGLRTGVPSCYVTTESSPREVGRRLGREAVVLDARPEGKFSDPMLLEQTLVEAAREAPGRVAIDGLHVFARRWGAPRALGFFTRVCPRLFDLGAIAYWRAPRRALGSAFIEEVRKVTQCVVEERRRQLRVVKAEGRPSSLQGKLFRVELGDDRGIKIHAERALGRLGEGLARLREERHLSQADLARLAGVSASAISQAEAGLRGLSVDTLLGLSEQLGVGIDDILGNVHEGDYVLARRDRSGGPSKQVPLLDDPKAGLRAYLVNLGAAESGAPPRHHKGAELVLVASGLVQVDLGVETPVMRAGDALLASRVPVVGWRNLLGEPARLFWIIRD